MASADASDMARLPHARRGLFGGPVRLLGVVASAALIASACSSSTGSKTAGSTAGTGDSASATVAAAQAAVAKLLPNPTTIDMSDPLKAKPPTGKLLVYLTQPIPTAKIDSGAAAAAAKVLGWDFKTIALGSAPTAIQSAFDSALALKPTAIVTTGAPKVAYASQLAKAKSRGIAVISYGQADPAGTGDGIVSAISDTAAAGAAASALANLVVADSKGKANVAIFNVANFPILSAQTDAFKSELKKSCPSCSTKEFDQQFADVGTKTPQNVVAAFRSNPSLNYAYFTFGDMTFGVDSALKSAGLAHKVKVVGAFGSATNIAAVKSGAELGWTSESHYIDGTLFVDAAARFVLGQDPTVSAKIMPIQLITTSNVGDVVLDSNGNYIGVKDYESQFKQLWKISG